MREARVWVLPGVGADSRIFRNLEFPWSATYLEWILPEAGESLSSYADRLMAPHDIQSHDLLFGYNFGGIIAQDWASRQRVQRVVLLNSLHHNTPLRPLFTRIAATRVLDWAPEGSIRRIVFFMARLNSRPTTHFEGIIEMMEQFPCDYYRWVLKAVVNWRRPIPLCPVDSVKSDSDVVFPKVHDLDRCWTLNRATHLSFLTHAKEISTLLKEKVDPMLS
jgi:pimeloyl-ACP methyl ester carboxylesterase